MDSTTQAQRDKNRLDYENLKAKKWVKEVDFMGFKTLQMNWDAIERPPANSQGGPAVFYEKVVTGYKVEGEKQATLRFDEDC